MKTSNILLIGLLAITLLFGFTSNLVLKTEFDKIDQKDPFAGYHKQSLKPFKYVTIQGKILGHTQISPGKEFEIRSSIAFKWIKWKIQDDTLKIAYTSDVKANYPAGYNFGAAPTTYIMAPRLSGVTADKSACKISDWTLDSFQINQQGEDVQVDHNTFGTLLVNLEKEASFRMSRENKINSAKVLVKEASKFETENVYKTFQIKADSTARVSLPGSLLQQAGAL